VAVRVIKAGASGFLTKDSAVDDLHKAIQTILAGNKYIDEAVANLLALELSSHASAENQHDSLSDREFEVFLMIARGKKLTEIANELSLSIKTISTYRTKILQKMNFSSNSEITSYAIRRKLIF
jgi:two-component system invasion response regulator UvrY